MIRFRPARVHRTREATTLLCSALFLLGWLLASCSGHGTVTVYTAASLTGVMEDAGRRFESETGIRVATRTGASGSLGMSIENGAPADLFVSAATEWMDHLAERGLVDPASVELLGWNRIVFVVPVDAAFEAPQDVLSLDRLTTIAMGDPEYVPAGKYTAQSLTRLEAWDLVAKRLVLSQDARAALALVERKEVDGGFVYASDAAASRTVRICFALPEATHDPIVYPAAILLHAPHSENARRFLDFLSGAKGKEIFRAHGLGGN